MRAWYLLLFIIPPFAVLEYQAISLGNRIDTLHQIVQGFSNVESMGRMNEHEKIPSSSSIAQLQKDIDTLKEQVSHLQYGPKDGTGKAARSTSPNDPKPFDEQVLTVLRSESERIRDAQLARNRAALIAYRKNAVKEFARRQGLSAAQESAIMTILEDEVDRMVEILKNFDWEEEKANMSVEWMDMIRVTNDKAQEILDADQMSIFLYLRHLEQQALAPWLPK